MKTYIIAAIAILLASCGKIDDRSISCYELLQIDSTGRSHASPIIMEQAKVLGEHLGPRSDLGVFILSSIQTNTVLQFATVRDSFNQCKRNPSISVLEAVQLIIEDVHKEHALSPRWASCRAVMKDQVPFRSVLEQVMSTGNPGMLPPVRRRLDEVGHTDFVKRIHDQLSKDCKKDQTLNATRIVQRLMDIEARRMQQEQKEEMLREWQRLNQSS
ncbi:hypothetical protein [Alkalimonas amylolytica]|uniref:Lipoprotein n=1 Tax=Alkalimonas amylolytica TaxID=152573 RepID=A0A1H3YH55_ALKAM|nr:hypothetical protein [Alkalimonas amylolytica]SEA10893.1 hypothetical protein SAMN04488051_101688 [Alkalimonas amylolytica]